MEPSTALDTSKGEESQLGYWEEYDALADMKTNGLIIGPFGDSGAGRTTLPLSAAKPIPDMYPDGLDVIVADLDDGIGRATYFNPKEPQNSSLIGRWVHEGVIDKKKFFFKRCVMKKIKKKKSKAYDELPAMDYLESLTNVYQTFNRGLEHIKDNNWEGVLVIDTASDFWDALWRFSMACEKKKVSGKTFDATWWGDSNRIYLQDMLGTVITEQRKRPHFYLFMNGHLRNIYDKSRTIVKREGRWQNATENKCDFTFDFKKFWDNETGMHRSTAYWRKHPFGRGVPEPIVDITFEKMMKVLVERGVR